MFEEKTLREIAMLQAQGPILSLYLDVDPTQHTVDEYKLTLRDLLKQAEDLADAEDIEAVKHYIDFEYDWSGRGLVIFSRKAEGIWIVYPLAVAVVSGVTIANKPYISPLVELVGLYGRYVVAVTDRQQARFYLFEMGEIVEIAEVIGEEVRTVRKGRGSSVVGMRGGAPLSGRKEAEIVQRNLRDVAEALVNFCQQHHPRRLLLAGTERTLAQLREYLPQHIREIIVGSFNADLDTNEVELRQQSQAILEDLQKQRQADLVEMVVTAAAKGSNGVVRLDDTLSAAHEGRIQVLVVERNFHQVGYRCTGCGYLTTQELNVCPFCSSTFEDIPDAAEAVVTQVIEKGGTVEVVPDGLLGEAHIGALLRY